MILHHLHPLLTCVPPEMRLEVGRLPVHLPTAVYMADVLPLSIRLPVAVLAVGTRTRHAS